MTAPRPARLTTTMQAALDLVAQGHAPRVAAHRAGCHLTSLYAAMRRLGLDKRCPHCGQAIRSTRYPDTTTTTNETTGE